MALWCYLLPVLVFFWAVSLGTLVSARDKKTIRAILRAGDVVLSEAELQKRKDGKLVSLVATWLPRIEKTVDLDKIAVYNLKTMLQLMGEKKTPERVYADHLVTAFSASSVLLILPLITGFSGYILLYPAGVLLALFGQAQMVKRRFKVWQNEIIKDIPELIDKMRISLASGKDYISAFKKVQENSGPRLSSILERLINDMQVMRPSQALDQFAASFGMPVMIKFTAAVKVGIESGYDQAENYFDHIEKDIRELRQLALEELTRNKPQKVLFLKAIMIAHAMAALALTVVNLFSNMNKLF